MVFYTQRKTPIAPTVGVFSYQPLKMETYIIYMRNHTSNSKLKVDGKMSEQGVVRAGLLQSVALIIFASSSVIAAISTDTVSLGKTNRNS